MFFPCILSPHQTLLELLSQDGILQRLMSVLYEAATPGDITHMQAGYWVVHYGMQLLTSWAFSDPDVKIQLCQSQTFDKWLQRLVLKTSELFIRREVCEGLFRMCEGSSLSCQQFAWALLSSLLSFLSVAQAIVPKKVSWKDILFSVFCLFTIISTAICHLTWHSQ